MGDVLLLVLLNDELLRKERKDIISVLRAVSRY
jgi:hypothetical protein